MKTLQFLKRGNGEKGIIGSGEEVILEGNEKGFVVRRSRRLRGKYQTRVCEETRNLSSLQTL